MQNNRELQLRIFRYLYNRPVGEEVDITLLLPHVKSETLDSLDAYLKILHNDKFISYDNPLIKLLETGREWYTKSISFTALSPIATLDSTLNILAENGAYTEVEVDNLFNVLYDSHPELRNESFDSAYLFAVCEKLVKDGYAIGRKEQLGLASVRTPFYNHYYKITFEGIMYKEDGGYFKEREDKQAANTRLTNIERNQTVHRIWMTILTAILVIGTTIAAIYYGIEIYKYYHPSDVKISKK